MCIRDSPYTFQGHVFTIAGSLTDTVASTTGGCDTIRTITVAELPLLTSTVNLSVCANQSPYTFQGHVFTIAGSLSDTVASTSGGCDTIRTITVAPVSYTHLRAHETGR